MDEEEVKIILVGALIFIVVIYGCFVFILIRKTFVLPPEPRKSTLISLLSPAGYYCERKSHGSSFLVSICPSGQCSRVSAVVARSWLTKEARVRFPDLAFSLSYRPNANIGAKEWSRVGGPEPEVGFAPQLRDTLESNYRKNNSLYS